MIKVEDYPIFQNHLTTLKETFVDNHGGSYDFMTESLIAAVDFDAVLSYLAILYVGTKTFTYSFISVWSHVLYTFWFRISSSLFKSS